MKSRSELLWQPARNVATSAAETSRAILAQFNRVVGKRNCKTMTRKDYANVPADKRGRPEIGFPGAFNRKPLGQGQAEGTYGMRSARLLAGNLREQSDATTSLEKRHPLRCKQCLREPTPTS
jgi:hypothetical protein